ncbi:hypothetical protein [Croceibacterium mercuriale]|uniref:hypothetical protein n=1 Tax=Croceibacterium mercuriale TaxID=1572751 RepID=UPI00126997DA|nr:hypothetical protein [Croceibacterium mercuriale]
MSRLPSRQPLAMALVCLGPALQPAGHVQREGSDDDLAPLSVSCCLALLIGAEAVRLIVPKRPASSSASHVAERCGAMPIGTFPFGSTRRLRLREVTSNTFSSPP